MTRDLLISAALAVSLHGAVLFGYELFKKPAANYETVDLVATEALPPPPPPPVEPEEEDEDAQPSDEPVLPEELINTGLAEPVSSDVALSALAQIVKPEPPRPPRPTGLDSALIPTGAARTHAGQGGELILNLADLDRLPRVRYEPAPVYPYALKNEGVSGVVTAEWVVNKQGRVVEVRIISSTERAFDAAVLEAVHKYRIDPGTKNGRPVFFRMSRDFTFSIKSGE